MLMTQRLRDNTKNFWSFFFSYGVKIVQIAKILTLAFFKNIKNAFKLKRNPSSTNRPNLKALSYPNLELFEVFETSFCGIFSGLEVFANYT